MSRFRVVVAGGPIRDVAVETMTNRLQTLLQDSEPQLAKESQLRVCRELPNGARQRQKPQQEFGQSSHSGKTTQLGSSRCAHAELGDGART